MRVSISVKMTLAACFYLLTFFLTMPAWARGRSHPPKQENPSDPGYVLALRAANHFLHAWQTGDVETGMVLLGDGLRHTQSADKLEEAFSHASHAALEITRVHVQQGLYSYAVVRLTFRVSHVVRRFSEIILV